MGGGLKSFRDLEARNLVTATVTIRPRRRSDDGDFDERLMSLRNLLVSTGAYWISHNKNRKFVTFFIKQDSKIQIEDLRFEFLTAVKMSILVFWAVKPGNLVGVKHGYTTQKTKIDVK
jgi:hypothetical protein